MPILFLLRCNGKDGKMQRRTLFSELTGNAVSLLGLLICVAACVFPFLFFFFVPVLPTHNNSLIVLLALLVFALGAAIVQLGRRMTALRAGDQRANDSRRPVLLLRSFSDDHKEISEPRKGLQSRVLGFLFGYTGGYWVSYSDTLEVMLTDVLSRLGPVLETVR